MPCPSLRGHYSSEVIGEKGGGSRREKMGIGVYVGAKNGRENRNVF